MPQVQLTEQECRSAYYLAARPTRARLLTYAAVALVLLLYALWSAHRGSFATLAALIAAVIAVVLMYALYLPWKSRRVFRQQKSLHRPYELRWDETGLTCRNDLGEVRTPWTHVVRWRENDRVLLLYHSDVLFQIIPKRAFEEAPAALEEFRSLLRSRSEE